MGIQNANWITATYDFNQAAVYFQRKYPLKSRVRQATLWVTARGIYEISLNGRKVGDFFLAPGWTNYHKRIQYQQYDVTNFITEKEVQILAGVGNGWYRGRISYQAYQLPAPALIAALEILYDNGDREEYCTDDSWESAHGQVLFNDIYDGEVYDAREVPSHWEPVAVYPSHKEVLIPQEGEIVCEQQTFSTISEIHTPRGETVLDFGQNLTGYVRFHTCGKSGEKISLSFAEVLDAEGNFYIDNYRSAKSRIEYISDGITSVYHPHFTFQGFRYVRIDEWPDGEPIRNIQAVAIHSDMKRTGWFQCSNPQLNTLYENIIWGQRGNFVDIPTDCPQRDERMGWTGDAEVFCRAASYNFDVEKFFRKWLRDLKSEQRPAGDIPRIIPKSWADEEPACAAWGDAAVICPWQIYQTYGDIRVLQEHYRSMCRWVDYIRSQGNCEELWNTGDHYGDWLGLDATEGSYKGKTDIYLIASAYYFYSTTLICKAGEVLGENTSDYQQLAKRIQKAFFQTYLTEDGLLLDDTQTAYALVLGVELAEGELQKKLASRLAQKIQENGNKIQTGFVGTPFILHVLVDNGYSDLAMTLLLQQDYPSWLYPISKGATTIWEHWDGIKPDGSMWSHDMNSFNHYAYGAVADFLYGKLCGIEPIEPGFRIIRFAPHPDKRLEWAEACIQTRYGMVRSGWKKLQQGWEFTFEIPESCKAYIEIGKDQELINSGIYTYHVEIV